MGEIFFVCKKRFSWLLMLLPLIFSAFQPGIKPGQVIVLHNEALGIIPKEFYITDVIDDREDRSAVAWLLPVSSKTNTQIKTIPVDFEGGALVAIKQFIARNLPVNKSLTPITIHLRKIKITETTIAGGMAEGHISFIMSFNIEKGEDNIKHLVDYNGSVAYTRPPGPAQEIEPIFRHLLKSGLSYINAWMDKQAGTNIKLAKSVKVTFTDFKEKPEGDTIYYDVKRLLNWNDFQSTIKSGRYDAEVFPTIGYDEQADVINGILNINLAIKVSMPKSACWVKDGSKSSYALNHEQRHFDIAKLVAEHFKQKKKTYQLPVDNYDAEINAEYLETYREMDNMQKQYDDETMHGANAQEQQRWNELIDKELKRYGVKE